MEYQTINLQHDTTNQQSQFIARNGVEINDESKRMYDSSNTRFKTSIIRSHLCDYSHAYILVKGTITVPNTYAAGAAVNNTNKKIIFKNCVPFTNCITKINNTKVHKGVLKFSKNSKTSPDCFFLYVFFISMTGF